MKIKSIPIILFVLSFLFPVAQIAPVMAAPATPDAAIYYVSQSTGDDDNDGLSESKPFQTVDKINTLELNPGDQVLFKCGDTWPVDPLVIVESGTVGEPITFGSYPADCVNQPVLSGAQSIVGWSHETGNIYFAELDSGANAGKFTLGINQLFRGEERLILGRWPNINEPDGGYATVDAQPSSTQIRDNQLPTGDWSGAVLHIKSIRWAMLNRKVTGSSGDTLSLGYKVDCWGGCTGWGFFLNNHYNTLDLDGEWFYDPGTQRIYLYSTGGTPVNIEGSVILTDDDRSWGGITLGKDLSDPISYVTVENFDIKRWFRHGIATPTNLHPTENHDLIIQNNTIHDINGIGINLATWVWGADNGRDGWRGGYNQLVTNNLIERSNQMGINTYGRNSTFRDNTIRDIARIENLGAAGMGCGFESGDAAGGVCTEDGDGIRVKIDQAADSGRDNSFIGNRLERIGYNGIDVFGYRNTFEHNVIIEACISKGDCGGVRTFGRDDLDSTAVHDLTFIENVIVDTIGNTDGCHPDFDTLFGFGFYLDHFSRDITLDGNTVISSTVHGALFQNATGNLVNNTFYNNGRTYPYAGAQVLVGNAPALLETHTGNVLYSLNVDARTLSVNGLSQLGTSNQNYFFSPYRAEHIRVDGDKTLDTWQAYSGKDANSKEHWFTLEAGDPLKSRIFYNDTGALKTLPLGSVLYEDLDQNSVSGELTLAPYQSQILIETGQAADLALSMTLWSSDDPAPGAPLTYTISINNQGVITASQVRLESPLPAEIDNANWQASPDSVELELGSLFTWEIDHLRVGETYIFTITGRFSPTLTPGMPLLLRAAASTSSTEVNLSNNQVLIHLGEWKKASLPLVAR